MVGKKLFAPKEMNRAMSDEFSRRKWKESRTSYWVTKDAQLIRATMTLPADEQKEAIIAAGHDPIYSYNQHPLANDQYTTNDDLGFNIDLNPMGDYATNNCCQPFQWRMLGYCSEVEPALLLRLLNTVVAGGE